MEKLFLSPVLFYFSGALLSAGGKFQDHLSFEVCALLHRGLTFLDAFWKLHETGMVQEQQPCFGKGEEEGV